MLKNTINQHVGFKMLSTTDGSPITSGTPTVYVTGDGGTQSTGAGTATHEGNGDWVYVPTQAETSYTHILFSISLSGAFFQAVNVYTSTGDAYSAVSSLNNISSADVSTSCDTALSAYGANTITPPTVAEIRSEIDSNSAQLIAIVGDTNELQTNQGDWLTANLSGIATSVEVAALDTLIDGIKAKTDSLPADPVSQAALNNLSVADIISGIADGSYDLQEMIRIIFAFAVGKTSGSGTATVTIRNPADTKDRVVATVDGSNNRTAITLDGA